MTASPLSVNFYLTCRRAGFGPSTEVREHVSVLHPVASIKALIRRRRKPSDKLFAHLAVALREHNQNQRMHFSGIGHPCVPATGLKPFNDHCCGVFEARQIPHRSARSLVDFIHSPPTTWTPQHPVPAVAANRQSHVIPVPSEIGKVVSPPSSLLAQTDSDLSAPSGESSNSLCSDASARMSTLAPRAC
jgi:hypothetical protein